eukprot:TRINITY_DN9642_c0_g1_i2.p1 TRINITY_DN9642_c0_g1~~TRINITY_DN9642_c0_g1_i2.p1  ORF type:complete len:352 (+),score=68.72 TRINITY_DN9642_c0_g1_i2:109-1056(+)
MITIPLYVVALILRETLGQQAAAGNGAELFTTLGESLFTLFRCVVAVECSDDSGRPLFAWVAKTHGVSYALLYGSLLLFMQFGLVNVIVAIYVENVVAAAKSNEVLLKKQRLRDQQFFNNRMVDLVELLWDVHNEVRIANGLPPQEMVDAGDEADPIAATLYRMRDMELTLDMFEKIKGRKEAVDIFRDLDVSDEDIFGLFQLLDVDGSGTIDMMELQHGIRKLRGDARRSDVISLDLLLRKTLWEVRNIAKKDPSASSDAHVSPRLPGNRCHLRRKRGGGGEVERGFAEEATTQRSGVFQSPDGRLGRAFVGCT